MRVGIKAPKGVLLYGPPGTGKTLLAKALASTMHATFVKTVASSLIEGYIGESSRIIRELFSTPVLARTRPPWCSSTRSTPSAASVERTWLWLAVLMHRARAPTARSSAR